VGSGDVQGFLRRRAGGDSLPEVPDRVTGTARAQADDRPDGAQAEQGPGQGDGPARLLEDTGFRAVPAAI
jgi:hypothetical protein